MARWYYCENGHLPLMSRHPSSPPPCTQCHGATTRAHDVVRLNVTGNGAYQIRWHTENATGNLIEKPMLKLVATIKGRQYSVLLQDAVLAYDAVNIAQGTTLKPVGGGRWVDNNLRNHAGGRVGGRNPPPVPAALQNPSLKLGNHGGGNQYGLIHILHRHTNMFNNMGSAPQQIFDLTSFRDNLRTMTGSPTGQGTGVRQIATQRNNNNIAIHGVANNRRAMLVIDPASSTIKTCWAEQNKLGGLGQNPVIVRRW